MKIFILNQSFPTCLKDRQHARVVWFLLEFNYDESLTAENHEKTYATLSINFTILCFQISRKVLQWILQHNRHWLHLDARRIWSSKVSMSVKESLSLSFFHSTYCFIHYVFIKFKNHFRKNKSFKSITKRKQIFFNNLKHYVCLQMCR